MSLNDYSFTSAGNKGWWSGQEQYNIAEIQARYGLYASDAVANIESAANERIATVMADANKYGYEMSYESALATARAQVMSQWLNTQGVVKSADRYAYAQEYTALLGLEGTSITALANKFIAVEQVSGQKYSADRSVDVAAIYGEAQKFTATETRLMNQFVASVKARADIINVERSSKAEEYKARKALEETKVASEAQKYSARRQAQATETAAETSMHGHVAASSMQSSSNLVSSGFGAMNYGQRTFNLWALSGTNEPVPMVQRVMLASVMFVLTMFVLFVAMDIFGIPILATLSDIIAQSGAKAVAFVEAVRNGAGNAGEIFSDFGAGIGASIGGMLSALWDKLNDFFDWLVEWISDTVATAQAKF